MSAKKWSISLLCAVLVSLSVFAGIMYFLDPMLNYGVESPPLTSYEYAEMYSNPGIAKHYSYDAVMVGTSMIENTDVDLCDELFNCNMVRLPYSGGTSYNMKTILDLCFQSDNKIQTVYWELDEFQLSGSATQPRYPLPMYLYRMDHAKDLSYLLNLDIFYHYGLKDIYATLQGRVQPLERRGITLNGNFSKSAMLASYNRPPVSNRVVEFDERQKSRLDANLDNIETLLNSQPETKFVFFLPPFSILYWDRELRQGTYDASMDGLEYAVGKLLTHKNVEVFFFQGDESIIIDLDNYKDYSHYGNWINDRITVLMAEGEGRVTSENYIDVIEAMRSFIHAYDMDAAFQ